MRVRIGTSGYSYPGSPPKGWHGLFYPNKKGKGFNELGYYTSFFDAAEINTTFYRPPTPEMAEAWVRETPPEFEFAIKVWQKFTHPMRLGEAAGETKRDWEAPGEADVEVFKRSIGALADSGKLGILLFQYPAGFHYTKKNLAKLQWTLRAFQGYPKAVELRHRSWSNRGRETTAFWSSQVPPGRS